MAGHDGGLEQRFVLEVIDIPFTRPSVTTLSDEPEHKQPVFTTQSNKPQFRLPILEPGKEYQALVYAENAKGRSEPPIVLSHIKLETPVGPPEDNGKALLVVVINFVRDYKFLYKLNFVTNDAEM